MSALLRLNWGLAASTLSTLQATDGAEKVSDPAVPSSTVRPVRGAVTNTFASGVGVSIASGLGSAQPARTRAETESRARVFRGLIFTSLLLSCLANHRVSNADVNGF